MCWVRVCVRVRVIRLGFKKTHVFDKTTFTHLMFRYCLSIQLLLSGWWLVVCLGLGLGVGLGLGG